MLPLALLVPVAHAEDHFGGNAYYLGDIHAHSGISGDGGSSDLEGTCDSDCGTFAEMFQVARDNGLDFAAVADHINGKTVSSAADQYASLIALTVAENDPTGGFVTLPAAEIWLRDTGGNLGHKTLLFFGDDADLASVTISDVQTTGSTSIQVSGGCADIWSWADTVQATWGDILLVPHHPALTAPMPTDWSCTDPFYEPAVEVYSEHGSSFGDGTGYDPPWSGEWSDGTVHNAISPDGANLLMGFVGGTDKHNSRPGDVCNLDGEHTNHPFGGGLTIAVIGEGKTFDRAAIYQAFVTRRTLATTGPLVPADIRYASGGVDLAGLGEGFSLPVDQDLDVTVSVPGDLAPFVLGVEVVTPDYRYTTSADDEGHFTVSIPADEASGWAYAAVRIDGSSWYGTAGCDDGGSDTDEYVWTSPAYFGVGPNDLDGDGVPYLAGDCDDDDAAFAPGLEDADGDDVDHDCDGCDGHCDAGPVEEREITSRRTWTDDAEHRTDEEVSAEAPTRGPDPPEPGDAETASQPRDAAAAAGAATLPWTMDDGTEPRQLAPIAPTAQSAPPRGCSTDAGSPSLVGGLLLALLGRRRARS